MSKKLSNCGKLEVRESPVEGFGVFATEDIPAGTILEEVPFVLFPRHTNISRGIYDLFAANHFMSEREKYLENLRINLKFKEPEKYYFKWHPTAQLDGDSMFTVLPLGYGPIYNSSNTDNNADWKIQERTFIFRAERDIKKDEEIRTFYGYYLAEDGSTFNCDLVFNLAFDTQDGLQRLKMIRFGALASFQAGNSNPAYIKLGQLIAKSKNGLLLKKILAVHADGKESASFMVPDSIPLSQLYIKLAEFKNHPTPLVVLFVEYTDKENGQVVSDNIVIKK